MSTKDNMSAKGDMSAEDNMSAKDSMSAKDNMSAKDDMSAKDNMSAEDNMSREDNRSAEDNRSTEEIKGNAKPAKGIKAWSKKKKITVGIIAGVVIAGGVAAAVLLSNKKNSFGASKNGDAAVNTAKVQRRDLTSEISSSGTIAAKNTYNITSLVSGEIIEADFEEGDMVEEGQVLYRIDASSMESKLKSANNSLERATASYADAKEDYEEALEEYADNTYKSKRTGYITKLYIEEGDKVSSNTQLADLYNEQQMKIKIPFLAGEAAYIGGGNGAVLTLTDTGEQLGASVYSVSNMDEVLDGGRIVRYVTFCVQNPGGLTSEMTATAAVGDFMSAGTGSFEAWTDTKLNCDITSAVEVGKLLVHEGDYVSAGTPIFEMTQDSAAKLIKTYKDAMDNAQEKLESAQETVDTSNDTYSEYTITSPVDGKVITKTYKVGDKISGGNNSGATTLAVIYDLSEYVFEMSVDELDVLNVEVGQTVRVEADAFEDEEFSGKVTNVSMVSSASNGVSTYPVTVTLDDTYDLLPGMNVDGYIVLGESKDTLAVPADALMRGNQVYVKDDSVTEAVGVVPAGFRAVEVETGLTNEDYVEILSGLNEGDEVYVPETSDSGMMGFMEGMPGGFSGGGSGGGMPGGGSGGPSGGPGGGSGGPGGGGGRP